MNKEQFIKRMSLIQNYFSEQETLQILINKLTDGFAPVNIGNYLVEELINMINEALHIEDKDLLSWWLYEDVEKIIYAGEYGEIEIRVKTLDELYDYIVSTK